MALAAMLAKDHNYKYENTSTSKENSNIVMCLLKATKEIDVPLAFPQTMFVRQIPLNYTCRPFLIIHFMHERKQLVGQPPPCQL